MGHNKTYETSTKNNFIKKVSFSEVQLLINLSEIS